ncbi:hypothetical protein, partial [Nostoc sp.]|uniref:hypothetical protein n=1 Tax=Nostoc sp. TaxID=1180 RepID=UPI003B5D9D79
MKNILQTSISQEQNSHQSYSISSYNRLLSVVKDLASVRTIEEIIEIVRLAARDLTNADGLTLPALKRRGFLNLRHNLLLQVCTNKSRGFI